MTSKEKPIWFDIAAGDAWKKAQKILAEDDRQDKLSFYSKDPVGFGTTILGERYTDEVKEVMESVRDFPITIAKSANGVGKSQPVWVQVATPDGWKPIGNIKMGDKVFGADGKPTRVVGIFLQGMQSTYEITFNDETSVLASGDHLWNARSASEKYRGKDFSALTTLQVKEILHRVVHIQCTQPVQYPEKELPAEPYLVGAFIGDGHIDGTPELSVHDEFIRAEVKTTAGDEGLIVREYENGTRLRLSSGYGVPSMFNNALKDQGLYGTRSNSKFIPDLYMYGSVSQRKRLLAGFMDTDGYIGKNKSIVYTTVSPKLAVQMVDLVQSLGGVAKIRTKETSGQLAYNIYLKVPFNPFETPFKANRWHHPDDSKRGKPIHRVIKSIEYHGLYQSVCIQVENSDGLYLTENYAVTHNSHGAARIALWFYLAYPDSKVYLTAAPPLENLKRILWGEVMSVVQRFPHLFTNDKKLSMNVERSADSFITCVTIPTSGSSEDRVAKFSGKHAPHILFIVDEGDAVPDEVYTGIEGCMSGGMARMLIMFNPKATFGPVYQKEYTKQANVVHLSAFSHPNVISGKDKIPGAVDRNITMRRINEWTRPLAPEEMGKATDDDSFVVPDFLVGETGTSTSGMTYSPLDAGRRRIVDPAFSYMVLGQYPPQSEMQLISRAWVNAAMERFKLYRKLYGDVPPEGIQPLMGLDAAELGTDPNVVCMRYGDYVLPFITWNGVDSDLSADQGLDLYLKYNVDIAYIDATGVGSHIAPRMSREGRDQDVRAVSVKVGEAPTIGSEIAQGRFYSLRDELWWSVREWLRKSPTAMLPDDPMLAMDLTTPTYDTVSHKGRIKISDKKTMRERLRRSPDRGDALCLTFMPLMRPTIMRLTDYAQLEA